MNHKKRVPTFLIQLGILGMAIFGILMHLIADILCFLSTSSRTSDPDEASDVAPSGGVFNYRIGKLDDGMDPIGWYEGD